MNSDESDPVATHWRLDRRIPLALVLVMVGQFAAGVAAFTKMQSDVSFIREHITDLRERVATISQRSAQIDAVKVELRFLNESHKRMRNTLDRLIENRRFDKAEIEKQGD